MRWSVVFYKRGIVFYKKGVVFFTKIVTSVEMTNYLWKCWTRAQACRDEGVLKLRVNFEGRKCSYIIAFLMSSTLHNVLSNISHLKCRGRYCLKMSAGISNCAYKSQCLSQDDSYDVVVTVVWGVGLNFSIFFGFP